jgi:hypothetical protein
MLQNSTTSFISKWARRYVGATLSYGFVRAATNEYYDDTKKLYYNSNTRKSEHKDRLLVYKLGRISSNTFAAVTVWPLMVGDDLIRLECAVRGKDPKEYESGVYFWRDSTHPSS